MEIAGDRPSIVSTASDDFPEPDSPVNTTRAFRGNSTSMFLRLCSRAPRTTNESPDIDSELRGVTVRGSTLGTRRRKGAVGGGTAPLPPLCRPLPPFLFLLPLAYQFPRLASPMTSDVQVRI